MRKKSRRDEQAQSCTYFTRDEVTYRLYKSLHSSYLYASETMQNEAAKARSQSKIDGKRRKSLDGIQGASRHQSLSRVNRPGGPQWVRVTVKTRLRTRNIEPFVRIKVPGLGRAGRRLHNWVYHSSSYPRHLRYSQLRARRDVWNTAMVASQWLFPVSALCMTPSVIVSNFTLQKELYDRARGVEFLFRLGSSLGLPSSAMFTAATWFHRFYMRASMEDYHRQDVAASCIFLATKTEECGRKLRDVARVCQAKISGVDVNSISPDSKEVENLQTVILLTEEVLLEVLCFDFVIESPHAELVDIFDAHEKDSSVQDYAWTIAHDSYRVPLCILYPPRIIAAACHVLAQRLVDGPHSPSLDARLSSPPPSASLPTPPSHNPASPDASRFAIEYFGFGEAELGSISEALCILLEFYKAQDAQATPYISSLVAIPPPAVVHPRSALYATFPPLSGAVISNPDNNPTNPMNNRTPSSSHGGSTPAKPAWLPVKESAKRDDNTQGAQ